MHSQQQHHTRRWEKSTDDDLPEEQQKQQKQIRSGGGDDGASGSQATSSTRRHFQNGGLFEEHHNGQRCLPPARYQIYSSPLPSLPSLLKTEAAAAANAYCNDRETDTYKSSPCSPVLAAIQRWTGLLFFVVLLCLLPPSADASANIRAIEKKILDRIIGEGYDSRIRPMGNASTGVRGGDGPAVVNVNLLIRSISKIDDVIMEYSVQLTFRQTWIDSRLKFDDMNGQIRYLVLTEPGKVWRPDLFFKNEKEGHFHNIILPNVLLRIHPNGDVLYSIRISLVLACPMDLKYYPLDKQVCQIEMASYGYTTEDLMFLWKEISPVQITTDLHLPRFTLEKYLTDYCTSTTNTGSYSCLRVSLLFKREFSYYLIQIYIPCCMLVIVSWVSFWLDPNAIPARVSLGVTTLLTMATSISGINSSLPPVSYTKAIDVWTGVCLTFVFGALLEFALVNYASRSDAHRAALKQQQAAFAAQRKWDLEQHAAAMEADHIDERGSAFAMTNENNDEVPKSEAQPGEGGKSESGTGADGGGGASPVADESDASPVEAKSSGTGGADGADGADPAAPPEEKAPEEGVKSSVKSGIADAVKSATKSGVGSQQKKKSTSGSGNGKSGSAGKRGSSTGSKVEAKPSRSRSGSRSKVASLDSARIGFIGAGRMTDSIIKGLLKAEKVKPKQIFISAKSAKNFDAFKVQGITTSTRAYDIFGKFDCDVIFMAVHGFVVRNCFKLGGTRPLALTTNFIPTRRRAIYVLSLIGGVPLSDLKQVLLNPDSENRYKVAMHRVMLNTSVAYGLGLGALDVEVDSKKCASLIRDLLQSIAKLEVPRAKRAGPEETEVDSGQVTSEIRDKVVLSPSVARLAVHSTRRRGLAPLVHFKLPLPRVPRAKRAGPEAAEVKVYKRCRRPLVRHREFGNHGEKMRTCEIHVSLPKRNWCKRWLSKFPTRSKRIDVISRIFFPLMFALFNLVYWTTYLFREDMQNLDKNKQ
ncbi:Glycine receptor subunit alpha-3 [Tyrophagus putrescentiae]|nr:Glycine receptor subunit alpha-3 [Tyrophagus putrescentiae]